jgi:APA family basic amino acid/polyamine antiporter
VFTSAKVLALLAVVGVGFVAKNAAAVAANFGAGWRQFWAGAGWGDVHTITVGSFWPGTFDKTAMVGALTAVAVVQVGSLFSSDSWNNVTFTAGEVRNPKRNLPLSLALGTGVVLLLYIACNFVYLVVLPLAGSATAPTVVGRGIQFAAQDRVATAVMEVAFGALGAKLMAGAILISTFGCVNGILLSGARVYYAMSRDGLFFKSVGRLNERTKAPVNSLWVQWAWTCLLCLSGSYGNLLDYVIFAVLIFYILTILALFVLRVKRPEMPRPYRAIGYPVLPGLYLVMAAWVSVVLLRYKPQYTWPGLILVLLGVPVYLVWKRQGLEPSN